MSRPLSHHYDEKAPELQRLWEQTDPFLTLDQIKVALGVPEYTLQRMASQLGLPNRTRMRVAIGKAAAGPLPSERPRSLHGNALSVPRGVPTLPPLPSLMMPMPTFKE